MTHKIMTTEKTKLIGAISVSASAFMFGLEGTVLKLAYAGGFSVFLMAAMRYAMAALLFGGIVLMLKKPVLPPRGHTKLVLAAGCVVSLTSITLYIAYYLMPASYATLFFYSHPSFTILFSRIFLKRRILTSRLIAIILSVLGLLLLFCTSVDMLPVAGVLVALLSALTQSAKILICGSVLENVDTVTYSFNVTTIAAVIFSVITLLLGEFSLLPSASAGSWCCFLFLSVFVTAGGNFANFFGLNRIGTIDTSLFMLFEAPVSVVAAFIVLGDSFSGLQILGACLVIAAIAVPALSDKLSQKNQIRV